MIELKKDTRDRTVQSIRRYFEESMESEIGDLKATLLLDFFLKEVGPVIYNQAVLDAQSFMQERVGDLENSLYQPEFSYWKK